MIYNRSFTYFLHYSLSFDSNARIVEQIERGHHDGVLTMKLIIKLVYCKPGSKPFDVKEEIEIPPGWTVSEIMDQSIDGSMCPMVSVILIFKKKKETKSIPFLDATGHVIVSRSFAIK